MDEQLTTQDAGTQQAIRAWLDRDFDISTEGSISPDCVGVARAVDSASRHCLAADSGKQHKLAHKLSCQQLALTQAACVLLYQAEPEPVAARQWLQEFKGPSLRSGDALHLAMAKRQKLTIASADQRLVKAAEALGLLHQLV